MTGPGSPVYAFDTDSAQAPRHGDGAAGARARRSTRAATTFSAANHTFMTGAALVDGTTLGAARPRRASPPSAQTPVYGLPRYPVNRYALAKPKIGLFSDGATASGEPDPARRDDQEQLLAAASARRCSCSRRR